MLEKIEEGPHVEHNPMFAEMREERPLLLLLQYAVLAERNAAEYSLRFIFQIFFRFTVMLVRFVRPIEHSFPDDPINQ